MRSFTITKIWGIPIRVNTSLLIFLPILAWLIGSGEQIELYAAATTESRTVLLDELLEGIIVSDIMTTDPASIPSSATVDEFGQEMLRDRQTVHLVTGEAGEILGIVSLDDLKKVKGQDRASVRVADLLQTVPRIDAGADAFDTLAMLRQSGTSNALVETDGDIVGVLTEADYARTMTIRRGFQSGIGG